MKLVSLFAVAAALALGPPALAQETTINYSGVITQTPDPTQAYDLTVGETVSFSVTYDPSKLINDSDAVFYDGVTQMQHSPKRSANTPSPRPTTTVTVAMRGREQVTFQQPSSKMETLLGSLSMRKI